MALFTEGAVTVGDGLPRGAEGSRFRRLLGHPCLSVLHPTWSVSNWDHGGCQNMKQKILVLTGTICCAALGRSHSQGRTCRRQHRDDWRQARWEPEPDAGTRRRPRLRIRHAGASANPNGTNTPGATQPGTMPSVAPTRRLPHLGRPMLRRPSRVPRPTRPLPRPTRHRIANHRNNSASQRGTSPQGSSTATPPQL